MMVVLVALWCRTNCEGSTINTRPAADDESESGGYCSAAFGLKCFSIIVVGECLDDIGCSLCCSRVP